jgi:alpha-beta hydrolase superfamily lysophospholipase
MHIKRKNWLVLLIAALGLGFAILNVLAYNHAHAMMFFSEGGSRTSKPEELTGWRKARVLMTGVNVPRPESGLKPADLDPDCRRIPVRTPDGVTLGTWYSDRGTDTPLVILFHGYGAEKSSLLQTARTFIQLGTSVMIVDFRGSGESSETYTTIGFREADDVAAVMRHSSNALHHSRIILYGQSMGAVAILRAVSRNGIKPDAVIVEAVFDSMLSTVRHRFESMGVPSFPSAELLVFWGGVQTGFNAFKHNPVIYAKTLECPALFMHGTDDPRARIQEGRRVFAAVPGTKQFKEFNSAGHESYSTRFPAEWKATVDAFLKTSEPITAKDIVLQDWKVR